MVRGTLYPVNRATIRPLLIAGVEKRLMLLNALLSFPLVAATHFMLPAALLGVVVFVLIHFILVMVSKHDPCCGLLFRRSTRFLWQRYYPAVSHPALVDVRLVNTLPRSWR